MASFGAQLKQEREKQKVSLDDISLTTKISTRMLRALEEEHFDQLPGGIFNKGFIRAYARCLGLDEDQAVADYLATINPPGKKPEDNNQAPVVAPPSREEFRDNTEDGTGLPWGIFAMALLVAALGLVAWDFYSRQSPRGTPPPATNPTNVPPVTLADQSPSPPPIESSSAAVAIAKPSQPALPSPVPANNQPPQTPTAKPSVSTPVHSPPPAPQAGRFTVLIKAREDSWLSVSVDGEVSTHGTLTASTEKSVHATKEITIKAGNVGALDFEFNGKELPPQGANGEVKSLTFDANGLLPSTPKPPEPPQLP